MTYPKLRYPIHTKGLSNEDRMILLAYDMLWRLKDKIKGFANVTTHDDDHDLDANLSNLGHHIETMLCGGDMALRFEGYDSPTGGDAFPMPYDPGTKGIGEAQAKEFYENHSREEIIKEFKSIVDNELESKN